MCYAGSLGSDAAPVRKRPVLFRSGGSPGCGAADPLGPKRASQAFTVRRPRAGAEYRTWVDTEPPDPLPALAGALVIGARPAGIVLL